MDKYVQKDLGVVPFNNPPTTQNILLLRVTPNDNQWLPFSQFNWLDKLSNKYLITNERSKRAKKHHHMVVFTKTDIEDFRSTYKENHSELKAGRCYNLQECESVEKALKYALKDIVLAEPETYFYKGFHEHDIKTYAKLSRKKFIIDDYMLKLESIKDRYLKGEWDRLTTRAHWYILLAQYDRPINRSTINNSLDTLEVRRYEGDVEKVKKWIENTECSFV